MNAAAYVGVAGWSLPRDEQIHFPAEGTHLQRYAGVFNAVEINSSFYRPHTPATYVKWASQVPEIFRFSVKLPKLITHTQKLRDAGALLDDFIPQASSLGERLGCLLVQLPPSLQFDSGTAAAFFHSLRERYHGRAVCEPRHETWFTIEADALLADHAVARVAADPARVPAAAEPGGWDGMVYYRLHGSPRMYYSEYATSSIEAMSERIRNAAERGRDAWCIFDNTTLGGAQRNALMMRANLADG